MPFTPGPRSGADRTAAACAGKRALALLLCFPAAQWAVAQTSADADAGGIGARGSDGDGHARTEESLNRVPISVSVETRDAMDLKGIKDFSDVVRFTPGVSFDTNETNAIAIRGIASSGGSGTTGIYIDDVPIQMRALGFNPDDALIKVFDLDRIEILRGPQGTLFGSGSEGGTVRYITSQPNMNTPDLYARAETGFTARRRTQLRGRHRRRHAAHRRHTGGQGQRLLPPRWRLDRSHRSDHARGRRPERQSRRDHGRCVWQPCGSPTETVTVTPSFFYQDRERNDVTICWPLYSDPGSNRYVSANPDGQPRAGRILSARAQCRRSISGRRD